MTLYRGKDKRLLIGGFIKGPYEFPEVPNDEVTPKRLLETKYVENFHANIAFDLKGIG